MTLNNRTKPLFAAALATMLKEVPLEKVKIKELCAEAELDRQVFYYYYHDKYDLVAQIFVALFEQAYSSPTSNCLTDVHQRVFEEMEREKPFWRAVFSDKSQLSIANYLHEFDLEWGSRALMDFLGCESLSDEFKFPIRYCSHANICSLVDWLQGKINLTAKQLAIHQCATMPKLLVEAYDARVARKG